MKRFFSLLIILALLLPFALLVSCSEQSDSVTTAKTEEKTPTVTEAGDIVTQPSVTEAIVRENLDDLPKDLKFDGKTVSFLYAPGTVGTNFTYRSLIADEESTDSVDAAIYERNEKIKTRLGIDIEVYEATAVGGIAGSDAATALKAGTSDYDIICGYQYFDIGLATEGYLLDLNRLDKYDADYLDFSKDYWGNSYMEKISYSDRVYWATGALALRYMGEVSCVFVNTSLYNKSLEATFGDIHEIVRSGKWTLDLMDKMCTAVYQDIGSEKDVADLDDILGFCNPSFEYFPIGAGVEFSKVNTDGTISITLDSAIADAVPILLRDMWEKQYNYASSGNSVNWEDGMAQFASGLVLFNLSEIFNAEICLREMTDDYSILPLPKMYDTQEYRTALGDNMTLFGINMNTDNIAACAATLEALCAESYKSVRSIYYDQALKYKYTRDDNTAEMIDLIERSIYTDFAYAWSSKLADIAHTYRPTGPKNFASAMKKSVPRYQTQLDKIIEFFTKEPTE